MQGCGGETPYCLMGVLMFFSNTVSSASRCYSKTQGAGRVDAKTDSAFRALTILKKQPSLAETALVGRFAFSLRPHVFCEV
jgi:hypothetical protein